MDLPQGYMRREGTSEAALEAAGQAVGGGCQSGYCGLPLPLQLVPAVRETADGHRLGALEGEGGVPPPLPMHP